MTASGATEVSLTPFPQLGQGREVALGDVDRELREAWEAIDEESRRMYGEGMLRLRELNLVVVAGQADLERARVTAALAVREHPGRVIVVAPEGVGQSASIATGCLIDRYSGRRVCSEEVVIKGAQGEEEQLQAAVLQVLVPDVPVVGWWTGAVTAQARSLPWLAEVSDQLVVDLARTRDRVASLGMLKSLGDAVPGLELREFSWLRSAPWRELTAGLFERPDRRRLVPEMESLRIVHRAASTEALLYAGWFASRLGLRLEDSGWSREEGSRSLTMVGRVPESLELRINEASEPEQEASAGYDASGLLEVRIGLRVESSLRDNASECGGRTLSIHRSPNSLVCMCGEGDIDEGSVLKSVCLLEEEDFRLLSKVIEARPRGRSFDDALLTAVRLWEAPGYSKEE